MSYWHLKNLIKIDHASSSDLILHLYNLQHYIKFILNWKKMGSGDSSCSLQHLIGIHDQHFQVHSFVERNDCFFIFHHSNHQCLRCVLHVHYYHLLQHTYYHWVWSLCSRAHYLLINFLYFHSYREYWYFILKGMGLGLIYCYLYDEFPLFYLSYLY